MMQRYYFLLENMYRAMMIFWLTCLVGYPRTSAPEPVFLHDSTYEFDGIKFGNISMRSLQNKSLNVHLATNIDFLITHIPPDGILDDVGEVFLY